MRLLVVGVILVVMAATGAFSASMTGSSKPLGGGSDTVPRCQVLEYSIAASDTISSVNAQVKCDTTGSYTATTTVASGAASGSGQTAVSLTANTAAAVAITISPSVAISGSSYNVDLLMKR